MTWVSRTSKIQVGHTVCYSAAFMRQIGIHDAETANARGTVLEIIEGKNGAPDRAILDWHGADLPERMVVGTLTRVTPGRGIADD